MNAGKTPAEMMPDPEEDLYDEELETGGAVDDDPFGPMWTGGSGFGAGGFGGPGGMPGPGGTQFWPEVGPGQYTKATADRVPALSKQLREQGEAVQVRVFRIAPGGAEEEMGKMPMDFATEDLIDAYGLGGTYRIQPIDSMGHPVGSPEPIRIGQRHPYLREVQETFLRTGTGPAPQGISPEKVLEMNERARQEARQDTVSILGLFGDQAQRVREGEERLARFYGDREDRLATERAKLQQTASADMSSMLSNIFAQFQAQSAASARQQKESSDNFMAMLQASNQQQQQMMMMMMMQQQQQKGPLDRLLEMLMSPAGMMMVKEFFGGKDGKDPMESMMQMVTLMHTINPPQKPQTLADQLGTVKMIQDIAGTGGANSDAVEIAKIASSTLGDFAAARATAPTPPPAARPKPVPAGPPKPAPKTDNKAVVERSVIKAAMLIEDEKEADDERLREIVLDQFPDGKLPKGLDLRANLMRQGIEASLASKVAEACAKAINEDTAAAIGRAV